MKTVESKFLVIEYLKQYHTMSGAEKYIEYAPNRREMRVAQMYSDAINDTQYFFEYVRDDGIIETHTFTNIVIARWTIKNLKRSGYKMENFKYLGKR